MRSCVVLGEGGFGRRVVAISRGLLRVRGVLCADGGLARWADPLGVEIGSSREQLREWLDEGVDLLFDFSGRWGLGRQELARVRRAIAYHDGPDVGDHATTRAILAGARQHHVGLVELGVDGEPRAVLATRPVKIAEDETTGTLNAKCFEVGVAAFEALLPRLLDDTAAPLDVGVSCGALSPSASPLVAAPELGLGALDFSRAARDLDRTLRALDFGPSVNTLCLPKVALAEGEVLVVRGGGYVAADGRAVPGEIVGRDGASWTVATGEGALVLREPRTLDGRPTDLPPVGARLATSPLQIALGLSAALAPHERFFVTRLREGAGAPAPFGRGSRAGRARTLVLPELVDPLGAFALVLRRAMDSDEPALLGLHTPEHSTWDARLHLPYAPFALPTGARRDVALFFAAVADERAAVQARRGMMRDLPLRFGLDLPALPVRVQLGGPRPEGLPGEAELLLHLAEDGRASLLADEGRISSDALSRLGRMIEVVAAGPHDVEAAVAPILDARERARSLSLAGLSDPTSATPGAPPTLAALWRASVDAHPSGRALEDAEGALSYAELAERTAAFAARLSSEGVGPGDRVGVAMERGLLSTIASLAILDVGATFVALDPTLPLERLQHVVDAAGLRLLLTSRACEATARLLKAEERVVEASWCEPVAGPRAEVLATSEGGAYLIFTSGSTGVPKGVLVPHRAIATQATAVAARYGLGPSDRALQVASPCFDLAIEELFAPLAVGATVVLAPPNLLQSYEGFRRFVEERELTFLNLPTAFFGGFMEHLARLDAPLPAALRGLVVGTDVATRRHLELFLGRCASRRPRWFNAYGLTEAAVTSTVYEHEGDEPVHPVPIGRPLPGTYAYVVDSAGEPRPQGLVGELWIGGAGLAEGYLSDGGRGQAELTTARFTADPFARAGRVYRTGDFAYCDERGQLCFIGRNDDQVKVRGYRVELGEIEVALCRHPRVRRAVVRAWPGAGADKRLCAYVEPDVEPNGGALARDELVAHLAAWLPRHAIPADFSFMDEIPVGKNGKLERNRLPPPPRTTAATEAPRGRVEGALAALFARALAVPEVGRHDDFFLLGGDSLAALELFAEIERCEGVALPLAELVRAPTVAGLAARLEALRARSAPGSGATIEAGFSPLVPLRREGSAPPVFCVCGTGGNVLGFRPLADALGPARPFFAFQMAGVDGRMLPDPHIEVMARRNVDAMLAHAPRDPLLLCGYSGGAVIAFEMAHQLRRRGRDVARLVILDFPLDAVAPESAVDKAERLKTGFTTDGARFLLTWGRGRLAWERERWTLRAVVAASRWAGRPIPMRFRERLLNEHWTRARDHHRLERYAGRVDCFVTEATRSEGAPVGWDQVADEVIVHELPGDHTTILQPPLVSTLAERLGAVLTVSP